MNAISYTSMAPEGLPLIRMQRARILTIGADMPLRANCTPVGIAPVLPAALISPRAVTCTAPAAELSIVPLPSSLDYRPHERHCLLEDILSGQCWWSSKCASPRTGQQARLLHSLPLHPLPDTDCLMRLLPPVTYSCRAGHNRTAGPSDSPPARRR